ARRRWGVCVERDGVVVDCDERAFEGFFGVSAGDAFREDVDQEDVIVGAARNDAEPGLADGLGQSLGVLQYLLLIGFKFGLERFFEADGLGSDDVNQRPTLNAREEVAV